jgi:hypothetical protein
MSEPRRSRDRLLRTGVLALATLLAAGCGPPRTRYPEALNSERPDERLAAIRYAADTQDRSVMGLLVDRLDDEDEGVRMYAILALERLTGTRLGYRYQDPPSLRWQAIERWRRHLSAEGAASRPGDDGPD